MANYLTSINTISLKRRAIINLNINLNVILTLFYIFTASNFMLYSTLGEFDPIPVVSFFQKTVSIRHKALSVV